MNKNDIELFNKAVESLRQYRRYEILDENNKNLLDDRKCQVFLQHFFKKNF